VFLTGKSNTRPFSSDLQILRLDIPLGGTPSSAARSNNAQLDPDTKELSGKPATQAKKFLHKHPTAKIVIIIDTHCLENGAFVWNGNSPTSYEACSLYEVSAAYNLTSSPPHLPLDPARLYPKGGISVYNRSGCRTRPPPQESHRKPCMWSVGHLRVLTPFVAPAVSLAPGRMS
jgi:hypothetical protein